MVPEVKTNSRRHGYLSADTVHIQFAEQIRVEPLIFGEILVGDFQYTLLFFGEMK